MNARERQKIFSEELRSKDLPKDALKILKRVKVPSTDFIRNQFELGDDVTDPDAIKHYAKFLLEHIKDPIDYTKQVQEHAEMYLTQGLKPIPLHPGTKKPIGRNWREEYLHIGEGQIKLTWDTINNIGLLTGPPSNLLVLDFESEEAFMAWNDVLLNHPDFQKLNAAERLIPTPVIRTGKGYHVWYIVKDTPENLEKIKDINGKSKKFFNEFEIRWGEGQVVAPPSLHPSGKFYQFVETESGVLDPRNIPIKKITVADVALILDIYHKTFKVKPESMGDWPAYLAYLVGAEEKYKASTSYALARIDFNTVIDDKKEAALLNALKKIWPEPGAGRWAASCAIAALLGLLGVPLEVTQGLLDKLVRTLQPDTPEKWIRDLAILYPKVTYQDLERYKHQVEEAKKLGKPIPKLPVAYKSLLVTYTPFTEEQVDEVRREVEQILGVRVAERLGLKKEKPKEGKEVEVEEDLEAIKTKYLLPEELPIDDAREKIEEWGYGEDKIQVKVITIPIVHYQGGTIRFSEKVIRIPLAEEYEPSYSYTIGQPLIVKPVKILKLAFFGEDTYVKLEVAGHIFEGPVETVVSELKRQNLLAASRGSWVGPYLSYLAKVTKEEVFTRLGVHKLKDGTFTWIGPNDERFFATSPMKLLFARAMRKYIENSDPELYKKFIQVIVKYKEHINTDAYWISMAYLFVSPFLSPARRVFKLTPILYLYNVNPGSGKSSLAKFITQVAQGIKAFDPDQLDSSFRFNESFDSVQAPLLFDEIGNLKQDILTSLMSAVTGIGSTTRGRGISTMKEYEKTAIAVFTSNKEPWVALPSTQALDRVIHVFVEPIPEKTEEFLEEIDLPFALQASEDDEKITVAHYFLPELITMVNNLGGESWLKERFQRYVKVGIKKGLAERGGRIVYKFAILAVGLELMSKFLKLKGIDLDIREGAKTILNYFKQGLYEYPKTLENFVILLARIKDSQSNDTLMQKAHDSDKGVYIITMEIISTIADEAKRVGRDVPQSLAELANLLASLKKFGTRDEIYPRSGVRLPSGRKVKAVKLPEQVVDDILGVVRVIEEEEEEVNQDLEKLVMWIDGKTFDELLQITGWNEQRLTKALIELEKMDVVYARDGKYFLNTKKAQEKGFPIIAPAENPEEEKTEGETSE